MTQGRLCSRCGALNSPFDGCDCRSAEAERRSIYDDPRWREFTRPIVIERDGGRCVLCGEPGNTVDHKLSILTLLQIGADPFDPNECQLLCSSCSGQKDGAGRARPAPVVW